MISVGLVGAAHIHTPGFIKRLLNRPEIAVKSVWDHDRDRAAKRAAELRSTVVADTADIWRDDEIVAVIICSETNLHEELVLEAAAAGKHLFVEKPLGMGAGDAVRMARAIESANVLFQTGYFMRGEPAHQFLKEQISAGNFGRITRVRHSNCHSGSLSGWFDHEWRWMADPSIAGVGAFGDMGTHSLDILMWLLGDVERVAAAIGTATGRYEGCDEYGEGMLQFATGTVGTLAAGWADVANPVRLLISGTEGHAHLCNDDLYYQSKHVTDADGTSPWRALPPPLPHAFELFLDAVVGKPHERLVTPAEAAGRSAVMEALYNASAERRWVEVEDLA